MKRNVLALGFALALSALACNSVLGIDDASLDPAAATESDPCHQYCSTIMANCTGVNAEYESVGVCLEMCSAFDIGNAGDQSGDSRDCRIYHAGAAASDPSLHCRHAGPLGGGVCGTDPCEAYCLLDFAVCGSQMSPPYASQLDCQNMCEAAMFPYLTGGNDGDLIYQSGNTLNCRMYHLEAAAEPGNPTALGTHCPHTAVMSATCQ